MATVIKITRTQQETLDRMTLGEWETPYGLKVSTTTLRALEGKGLVEGKNEIGILFFPRMK
jgi:hypothetical protein